MNNNYSTLVAIKKSLESLKVELSAFEKTRVDKNPEWVSEQTVSFFYDGLIKNSCLLLGRLLKVRKASKFKDLILKSLQELNQFMSVCLKYHSSFLYKKVKVIYDNLLGLLPGESPIQLGLFDMNKFKSSEVKSRKRSKKSTSKKSSVSSNQNFIQLSLF